MSDAVRFSTDLGLSATEDPADLIRLDLAASAALDLPGLKASVQGVGVGVAIGIRIDPDGTLHIDPRPRFLNPTGMSAELNLPIVSGGGYLGRSGDEFRGALAANMGIIQASAFAILGTREFSLLALLAAEFTPALQLSFGFTLIGIGGLVGIHRRADRDALGEAARSGRLSQLLFPRDPIAEADRLLGTLSACFPYEDGSFVVGPMLKLGWGTPTMISATIAAIAEPMNARIVIIGRVAVTLPAEQAALIRIEAIILGTLDDQGVQLDGSLVDSHIIGIPIQGDIAIRLLTAPTGLMVFSAGGFHPDFSPPAGLEGMRRLAIDLSPTPILHIGLQAYFAVTSSAVMFGAAIDLMAGFDGFGVRGHAAFDALLSVDPFYFTAHLEASVSVTCADFDVASVSLSGDLSGPAPWSIRGHASISILFWDVDVDLPEITWGPDSHDSAPAADPLAVLRDQVAKRENWLGGSADIPGIVRLRPTTGDQETAVHPLAELEFIQSAIPLDTEIQRVDGRLLAAPATLRVATEGAESVAVTGSFAPVRFFNLDAAAATAGAGFVELPAGRRVTASGAAFPPPTRTDLHYEQKVLMASNPWRRRRRIPFLEVIGTTSHLVALAPPVGPSVVVTNHHSVLAGVAVLSDATADWAARSTRVAAVDGAAAVQRESLLAATAAGTTSVIQAKAALASIGGRDATTRDGLQVVAAWEVAGPA